MDYSLQPLEKIPKINKRTPLCLFGGLEQVLLNKLEDMLSKQTEFYSLQYCGFFCAQIVQSSTSNSGKTQKLLIFEDIDNDICQ